VNPMIQPLSVRKDICHDVLFNPLHRLGSMSRPLSEDPSGALTWRPICATNGLQITYNPPFSGARQMKEESMQKQDILLTFQGWKNVGNLDYVACWYKKAAEIMQGTEIRTALVSTNSICQGESVANLWRPLFDSGVHIDFAHQTFRWDSEANSKAQVHCVIVGFSTAPNDKPKMIYKTFRDPFVMG